MEPLNGGPLGTRNSEPEYTPTTELVRAVYAESRDRDFYSSTIAKAKQYRESGAGGGEFDRWLAAHDAAVRDAALKEAASAVLGTTLTLNDIEYENQVLAEAIEALRSDANA